MSFGFSIGDFFAVGKLAWSVYKSCMRYNPERAGWMLTLMAVRIGKEAGGAVVELSYEGTQTAIYRMSFLALGIIY